MSNSLAALEIMAERQWEAQREVARLEEELRAAKDRLQDVSERQMPELMAELGIEEFKTDKGLTVSIKERTTAAPTVANRLEAYRWLEQNGYGKVVKYDVRVPLQKGDADAKTKLTDFLEREGYVAQAEPSVHSQTLSALVRELLESGTPFPMELLGVHQARIAKVEIPK